MKLPRSVFIAGCLFLSALRQVNTLPTNDFPALEKRVTTSKTTVSTSSKTSTSTSKSTTVTSSTTSSYPTPTVPIGSAGPFATVSGRMFQIQSKTQFFAGTNTWWLGHLQNNSDVDNVLAELALTQIKVTRVWGFGNTNDASNPGSSVYYQVLNSSGQYFNFDSNTGIPRLDYVVSAAEAKGVKIVLPLLNNWNDLGGINTYTTAYGGNSTSFYTDTVSQAAYKAWIKFIVNRYKSSPAIFSWELCNEPRCSGCSTSVITTWAEGISAYIKSIDSAHMVALGDEGWLTPPLGDGSYAYSGYEGVDFTKNLAISTLDYGTFHLYPDQWGYNDTWGNEWITQHDLIGKQAGKPVVFEEYGSTNTANHSIIMQPWQQTTLLDTSVAYDSFWQFATTLSGGVNPYDSYALYYNTTPGSDYEVLGYQHAAAMLAKNPVANQ